MSENPAHLSDMSTNKNNQSRNQPRTETPGVKGNKQFSENQRQEAADVNLSSVAEAPIYNFSTEMTDTLGNDWTYFDGPSDLGDNRRGWQSTHANGAVMEVSNNGTSTVGQEWYVRNADGLSVSGTTDYVDEAIEIAGKQASWGSCGIAFGQKTPWGNVEEIIRPALGITYVSTAKHDAVKLSAERNAAMPSAFRKRSGWYAEWGIEKVRLVFPADFVRKEDVYRGLPNSESTYEIKTKAARIVKDLYPDAFAAAGYGTVAESESIVLRKRKDVERSK